MEAMKKIFSAKGRLDLSIRGSKFLKGEIIELNETH